MNVHQNDRAVGSLSATDSNAQSFKSPDRKGSRFKKRSPLSDLLEEKDLVSIEAQAAYRNVANSAAARLGNAIAFNQAQDAFLQKVQDALQRMHELAARAESGMAPTNDKNPGADEFTELQTRLKDIGARMFKAAKLFQSCDSELPGPADGAIAQWVSSVPEKWIAEWTGSAPDSGGTVGHSGPNASVTGDHIDRALEAVAAMRANVGNNLEQLCLNGERLFASGDDASATRGQISDFNVAEASTKFARFDMLTKSGTAMLAQANALPESTLRLLN